jgi:hypothetical protein
MKHSAAARIILSVDLGDCKRVIKSMPAMPRRPAPPPRVVTGVYVSHRETRDSFRETIRVRAEPICSRSHPNFSLPNQRAHPLRHRRRISLYWLRINATRRELFSRRSVVTAVCEFVRCGVEGSPSDAVTNSFGKSRARDFGGRPSFDKGYGKFWTYGHFSFASRSQPNGTRKRGGCSLSVLTSGAKCAASRQS